VEQRGQRLNRETHGNRRHGHIASRLSELKPECPETQNSAHFQVPRLTGGQWNSIKITMVLRSIIWSRIFRILGFQVEIQI
jgi:hypothetical protein